MGAILFQKIKSLLKMEQIGNKKTLKETIKFGKRIEERKTPLKSSYVEMTTIRSHRFLFVLWLRKY